MVRNGEAEDVDSYFAARIAALIWLGGMFFFALVGAPVLRKVEPPQLRAELFRSLGERFRSVGWAAIGVLVLTGVANLHFRGMLSMELLGNAGFWRAPLGQALGWKLGTVVLMIGFSALHDFALGPASARRMPGRGGIGTEPATGQLARPGERDRWGRPRDRGRAAREGRVR